RNHRIRRDSEQELGPRASDELQAFASAKLIGSVSVCGRLIEGVETEFLFEPPGGSGQGRKPIRLSGLHLLPHEKPGMPQAVFFRCSGTFISASGSHQKQAGKGPSHCSQCDIHRNLLTRCSAKKKRPPPDANPTVAA